MQCKASDTWPFAGRFRKWTGQALAVAGLLIPVPPFYLSTALGAPVSLKVLSYNIRYGTASDGPNDWERRKGLLFELLQQEKADMIGLQEALRFQIDAIRAVLPRYEEIGVGRDDGLSAGEYSAVLYDKERFEVVDQGTFWYSDEPLTPGSKSWGNTIPRICSWGRFREKASGRSFYFFNTHFDHRSQPSRERSAVLLAERIAARGHREAVIVTGDFNAGEQNPAVLFLKKRARIAMDGPISATASELLSDAFRVLHPGATEVGTFNGFQGDHAGDKIDYVLVSFQVAVAEARIIGWHRDGRYPSDHYPVSATLSLP